jgi:hypothetical protein
VTQSPNNPNLSALKKLEQFPHFLRVREGDKNIFLLFMTNGKVREEKSTI